MKKMLLLLVLVGARVEAEPQRKLVWVRAQNWTQYAESDPTYDYTCYLPRRYRVQGLESQWLQNSNGLPCRLLATFQGDQAQVPPQRIRLEPALLPLSLTVRNPWRGVVSLRQAGSEMAILPEQWQPCQGPTGLSDGLYEATAWTEQGRVQLTDLVRLREEPRPAILQGPIQGVVSEGFVKKSLELYRQAHPNLFSWRDPTGTTGFDFTSLGLTTLGKEIRGYAGVSGLGNWVEGEWEAPLQVRLLKGWAHFEAAPQGQAMRLVRPMFAEVPGPWLDASNQLMRRFFTSQLAVPIPGVYLQPLLENDLVTAAELDQLQLHPANWGDRRSGCFLLTSAAPPSEAGPPRELTFSGSEGFALGFSAAALNRSLAQGLPRRLPLKVDLPKEGVPSPQVLIFRLQLKQLEIRQLSLTYQRGAFVFDPCEVAVHWQLGPLSGVEPAARLAGTARATTQGIRLSISRLEFLSPHILEQSQEEQQRLRAQIVSGVENYSVPLPMPESMATPIHPTARLKLTQLVPADETLWVCGQWAP